MVSNKPYKNNDFQVRFFQTKYSKARAKKVVIFHTKCLATLIRRKIGFIELVRLVLNKQHDKKKANGDPIYVVALPTQRRP